MSVKLLHKTDKRVRFYCSFLKEEFNETSLTNDLQALHSVESVRVNIKAKSIIFELNSTDIETIELKLNSLDISDYQLCSTFCDSCVDENPSISGVYRVGTATVLNQFISDERVKLAVSSIAATPVLIDGTKELFSKGLTSKVLESLAVGVSLARRDYLASDGTAFMLELAEYIESTISHKSDDLVKELAKPNVKEAWIELNIDGRKELKKVSTSELKVGDIVVVGTGETISIDGHIVYGNASVNQVSMTGEAEPVNKSKGDRVMSGTVIDDGKIKIWAESVGDNTATARIKNYITSSLNEKSSIGLKATQLADKLVPITLGLTSIAYLINRDFESVASVLQADYSCALKLATPVAFKTSISNAGKKGVLIKGAKSIEALSEADTFVFDKTGTLTYGELEVVSVESFDKKWTSDEILNLTASAEEHYFHPVAEAVVKAAKVKGFVHMHHEEVQFIVAHGVKTTVDGKSVVIGSRHFLEDDEKIDFSGHKRDIERCLKDGKTILYIGYNGKLLGTIGMRDRVRENAKTTIDRLKASGVKKIVMLTGDIESKAIKLANEIGVDKVYANLKPTDKADILKELKDEGSKVAFIGDGINDAPALINANVGISMSKGADIAKATADISLLKDDIEAVADARDDAIRTIKLIKTNFNSTIGVNSLILMGATFGLFSPITTAVLHNGTTIGLLINSIRR
jgi:heavy metal translocating P-type ATPase